MVNTKIRLIIFSAAKDGEALYNQQKQGWKLTVAQIMNSLLPNSNLKAVNRREAKGKGENERYTHLNAEFQRIARRDKKAFLSDKYKEIEENNRMEKTRDLFKKIRDAEGTFPIKMSTIKDRNGMDLSEAQDIKKWWQECTKEPY